MDNNAIIIGFCIFAALIIGFCFGAWYIGDKLARRISKVRERVWQDDSLRKITTLAQHRYWIRDKGRGNRVRPLLPSETPWVDVEHAMRVAVTRALDKLWWVCIDGGDNER